MSLQFFSYSLIVLCPYRGFLVLVVFLNAIFMSLPGRQFFFLTLIFYFLYGAPYRPDQVALKHMDIKDILFFSFFHNVNIEV